VVLSVLADRHKTSLRRHPLLRLFARVMRPLLIVGGLAAAVVVTSLILRIQHDPKSFWPLLLCGAVSIYFWWLAALLFDLAFTWYRYVRHAVWQKCLRQARKDRIAREQQLRRAGAWRKEPLLRQRSS